MKQKRNAGILLHITSLPSKYGVGTLGAEAYHFLDWMKEAKLKIWQVLPLVPTSYGDSPYQSVSSSALNYYMIDFDILNKKGILPKKHYKNVKFAYSDSKVDYSELFYKKIDILRIAFNNFDTNEEGFVKFIKKGTAKDFAIFMTIKTMHNHSAWEFWDPKYKDYSKEIEKEIIKEHNTDYMFWVWTQYEFLLEWNDLHKYAKKLGISIMGDMPLYVAYDSVEVWKNPELFILNEDKSRKLVAGCPPDVFSEDGQLWGNPVYDWKYMKETNYKWWDERIKKAFGLFDILRIDHFRGFDRFYAIPSEHDTARYGKWMDGPHSELFQDKKHLNIVAEDLGVIDDGVRTLMRETGYPGMKILEFAFDGNPYNEHKPSNYTENYLVYTGTHDNMPLYQHISDMSEEEVERLKIDLEKESNLLNVKPNTKTIKTITDSIVELAMASKANYCIIPMQDLLAQDGSTRMNLPSTVSTDNWSYRIHKKDLSVKLQQRIKEYVIKYNRK